MNRREILLATGAAIASAGCTRTLGNGSGPGAAETPTDSPEHRTQQNSSGTPTQADDCRTGSGTTDCGGIESGRRSVTFGRQRAEISETEFGGIDGLATDLSFEEGSEEAPPVLRATVQNTGRCGRRIGFGGEPPYTADVAYAPDGEHGLMLVPVDGQVGKSDENGDGEFTVVPESKTDGCWLVPDAVVASEESVVRYLDPCASLSSDYYLVGHSTTDRCLPKRTYEFSALIRAGETLNRESEWNCSIEIS